MFRGHLLAQSSRNKSLTSLVKRFIRLCSPCYLEGELQTLQNTFLSLGYPGNLIFETYL